MKMQRDVSVNGDKERTAKGSQLTRVVPPSFSVPFICDGESKVRCFFIPASNEPSGMLACTFGDCREVFDCYAYRDQGYFRQTYVFPG